jgi:hypothetical protein
MSYTYLQGPGAESSAECFSDIEPFVRSKLNLTAEKSCCNGSVTESCPGSRSGTTSGHLTVSLGGESSMSSAAGSRARTSAWPEKAQESTANDRACGAKWHESLAKYDPVSRSWKTRQLSFIEDSGECLATFPQWGTTRDGELFLLPTPAPRTCGKESGFWPTPCLPGNGGSNGKAKLKAMLWPTPRSFMHKDAKYDRGKRNLGEVVAGLESRSHPIATTTDIALFAGSNMPKSVNARAQQWTDTNTANETESCSGVQFPTPKSRDWKGQSQRGIHGPMDSLANLDRGDGKTIGGSLNPSWVEWLMNWPIK